MTTIVSDGLSALAEWEGQYAYVVPCDTAACPSAHEGDWASASEAGWLTDTGGARRCPACCTLPAIRLYLNHFTSGGTAPRHAGGEHPAERAASAATALADALEVITHEAEPAPPPAADERAGAAMDRFLAATEHLAAADGDPGFLGGPDEDAPGSPGTPDVPGPSPRPPVAESLTPRSEGPGTQDQRPPGRWVKLKPGREAGQSMLPAEVDRPLPVGDWKEHGGEGGAAG